MENKRRAGVLMHISSLPGKYGIGVMGKEATDFINKLERASFRYWQVLPLNPVDHTGSPYCSCSAFAGNISLIDPYGLYEKGLISESTLKENEYSGTIYTADYAFAYEKRMKTLREAFSRIDSAEKSVIAVFSQENPWAEDYAYYMALKDFHGEKPWWECEDRYARYEKAQAENKAQAPKSNMRNVSRKASAGKSMFVSPEIDCRGQTVDEGIGNIDKYIDDAFLAGLHQVTIIHGKGTGVLRDAVQRFLKKHPHVKSFRPGVYGEGEMGVTVVELKK